MTTGRSKFILLLLILSLPAFSEPTNSAVDAISSLKPGEVKSGVEIGSTPTVTAATPAKNVNDRAKSSAAAVALGMAAGAQQKIACFQMMQEALKEENKDDKALLMAMAQQMCAQADQTMANAMKNKESQKLVSASDVPKQSEMKLGNTKFGQDKIEEAEVPQITFDDGVAPSSGSSEALDDLLANQLLPQPDLSVFENETPEPADGDLKDPIDKVLNDPRDGQETSVPDRIAASNEDKGEETSESQNLASLGGAGFGSVPRGISGDSGSESSSKTVKISSKSDKHKRGSGIRIAGGEEGDGGGSSASSRRSEINSLFGQLAAAGKGGSDIRGPSSINLVTLPKKKGEKLPNLFEYATFRYRKLAFQRGQIRPQKISQVKVPKVSQIAKASKSFTSAVKTLDSNEKP